MSNCTQQSAGCQKGRPIKAGRLYYMKLLLITQLEKQKTNRQKDRTTSPGGLRLMCCFLTENAADPDASTRVIVFSEYRDSVNEITEILSQHRPLVRVMSFIGHASAGRASKGFTQKDQLKVCAVQPRAGSGVVRIEGNAVVWEISYRLTALPDGQKPKTILSQQSIGGICYYAPPLIGGGIKQCFCLTSVCRVHRA